MHPGLRSVGAAMALTLVTLLSGCTPVSQPSNDTTSGGLVNGGLSGSRWKLVELGNTADLARIVPTIEFGADGTVSGFSGCNTFNGTYTTDGDKLALGPLATTKIACERPASAVETEVLTALSGITTWSIGADGRLLLDGPVPLIFAPG